MKNDIKPGWCNLRAWWESLAQASSGRTAQCAVMQWYHRRDQSTAYQSTSVEQGRRKRSSFRASSKPNSTSPQVGVALIAGHNELSFGWPYRWKSWEISPSGQFYSFHLRHCKSCLQVFVHLLKLANLSCKSIAANLNEHLFSRGLALWCVCWMSDFFFVFVFRWVQYCWQHNAALLPVGLCSDLKLPQSSQEAIILQKRAVCAHRML